MRKLLVVIGLHFATIAVLGLCRSWFRLPPDNTDQNSSAPITADHGQSTGDEDRVEQRVHELGHKMTEMGA